MKKTLLLVGTAGVLFGWFGSCHTLWLHAAEFLQTWGALDQLGYV